MCYHLLICFPTKIPRSPLHKYIIHPEYFSRIIIPKFKPEGYYEIRPGPRGFFTLSHGCLLNARQRPSVSGEHHDVRHRHLLYGRATGPNGCQFSVRMRIGGPCLAHRLPRGRTCASARDISRTSKRLLSINQTKEFFSSPSTSVFLGQFIWPRIFLFPFHSLLYF